MTRGITTLAPAAPRRPNRGRDAFLEAVRAVPKKRARAIREALETGDLDIVMETMGLTVHVNPAPEFDPQASMIQGQDAVTRRWVWARRRALLGALIGKTPA